MNPLVTCICVTRNRRAWLPRAIECFLRQTYEPRELVIVWDGLDIADLVPVADLRIRSARSAEMQTIGLKRNQACEESFGDIIAHWDDDDHSEPLRLADQVARLAKSGKAVTGYHTMLFTDKTPGDEAAASWWKYTGSAGFVMGTSLCYRRDWWAAHKFPDAQIGEDSAFVAAACGQRELAPEGDLRLMYATIHDLNTSRRRVAPGSWLAMPGFVWRGGAA